MHDYIDQIHETMNKGTEFSLWNSSMIYFLKLESYHVSLILQETSIPAMKYLFHQNVSYKTTDWW